MRRRQHVPGGELRATETVDKRNRTQDRKQEGKRKANSPVQTSKPRVIDASWVRSGMKKRRMNLAAEGFLWAAGSGAGTDLLC